MQSTEKKSAGLRGFSKNRLDFSINYGIINDVLADVAELADALDSGSSESDFIWVQVPSSAPKSKRGVYTLFLIFIHIIF